MARVGLYEPSIKIVQVVPLCQNRCGALFIVSKHPVTEVCINLRSGKQEMSDHKQRLDFPLGAVMQEQLVIVPGITPWGHDHVCSLHRSCHSCGSNPHD